MKTDPAILVSSDGFRVGTADSDLVPWASVRRISTYKLDLLTTDEIRLLVEYDGPLASMEMQVSEEQLGFEQFKSFVETYFRFPSNWWGAVMKPPFERKESVLFVRAEQGHAGDARNARA